MQELSLVFGRVSRSTMATHPELKSHITALLERAYFNLHAQSLTQADTAWVNSITATCLQLCLDERVRALTSRAQVHLFEHVIRISEEHLREAKRHAAMASNVFYLKETALDAAAVESSDATFHAVATSILAGAAIDHSGRVAPQKTDEPAA